MGDDPEPSVSKDSSTVEACGCKIGRVSSKYDLSDLPAEIGTRWTSEEGASFRHLAEDFNMQVLRAAMREEGLNPLDGEVENVYRLLTADDVSTGSRIQARNRLEKHGIDPDDLQSEFVSYQTVNRHLKQCQNIENKRADSAATLTKGKATRRIRALENRTAAVTKNTLEQLQHHDELALSDFDVFVDIRISCNECGDHLPLYRLLEASGCDCS